MNNPYEVLGLAPGASADDVKKAYRRLARKLYPDPNPGDKSGEERFKDVASAYRVLGNADERALRRRRDRREREREAA